MDKDQTFENNEPTRYLVKDFYLDPSANILHFKQVAGGKDEFGNRVFTSPLSYFDADARMVKAHILVSPEGQKLITQNPGLLRAIDGGIGFLSEKLAKLSAEERAESHLGVITDGVSLTRIGGGNQSEAMLLEVAKRKFIVKTNKSLSKRFDSYSQPYTNEMLQIQTIQSVFGEDLKTAGVYIPRIFFATGHVSCSEYAEGSMTQTTQDAAIRNLVVKVFEYVYDHNKAGDPLWKDVHLDWNNDFGDKPTRIDLIKTKSGLAWIDPIYHKWVN